MNAKLAFAAALLALAGLVPLAASAQTNYTENFTGTTTTNAWTFLNGACLTAGTTTASTTTNPGCYGLPYYTAKRDTTFLGGYNGTFPDPANGGAVRFTNKYDENGAILSAFSYPLSTQGLQVSFTTVTYDGDGGGAGRDGADGISFFLQDASFAADVGAFGGSLAYTCSNANNDSTLNPLTGYARGFDGIQGGYIGLGIDEYGNFLNGVTNTLGETGTSASGDNTASGGGYQPGRIGLRGSGSITWQSLNRQYPAYYPITLAISSPSAAAQAVQAACRTGLVSNWSSGSRVALATTTPIAISPLNAASYAAPAVAPVYGDYVAVPAGYKVLPATQPIANETAGNRSNATPITYNLSITPAGLLSLSYSYNGGANQAVITNVDITQKDRTTLIPANPLPASVRFGFAGSTGGSRNVHEIMCFQATPSDTSSSSAGLNQKQTAKVQTGSQVYFAFYNPQTLAGSLTSQYLATDASNNLIISPTINWDGSCVLTGVALGSNCDTTGPAGTGTPLSPPTSRVIFSYNYNTTTPTAAGTPITFEWASLSSTAQGLIDSGDTGSGTPNGNRVSYLRGVRTLEQVPTSTTTFTGIYRDRVSVLGDIVDSSPTWVGPPSAGYPATWADLYNSTGDPLLENSGEPYSTYASNTSSSSALPHEQQRTNVVYAGANDGMLHGFRSGSYSSTNTIIQTNNDGQEVMAYVPGYIVQTIQNATSVAHNFSDPQYGHKFDVDATPGVGDLFYNGVWHTWLVGGLGPGGNAIYALDISDPDTAFVSETSAAAANVVKGEWSNVSIPCVNSSTCATSLGNTYGVPVIRRLHNGNWAAIFGNGLGSARGDAGIFIMLVDSSGGITFRYLSTGVGSATSTPATPNGIAFVAAADLDGDRITDYVYAGDIQGNLWRFDLTSTDPTMWAVGANPVYQTPNGQPITTAPIIAASPGTGTLPRVMVEFGTGQQTPQNLISAATYQTAQMGIYGIWDWNMTTWNSKSSTRFSTPLTAPTVPSAPAAAISGITALVAQTMSAATTATTANTGSDYRTVSANQVCFADTTSCAKYGWYMYLTSGYPNASDPAVPQSTAGVPAATTLYEQVVFNPVLVLGALVVNTTIPPQVSATSCYSAAASGWTMALDPGTGGSLPASFFEDATSNHNVLNVGTTPVTGLALGGTGSFSVVQYGSQYYGITQTTTSPFIGALNPPGNLKGKRLTWIQKR